MKALLVLLLASVGQCALTEQPCAPRAVLTATLSDQGNFNFNVKCPDGWKAVVDPKEQKRYDAKQDRDAADAINLLANHVSCVVKPKEPKP